MATVGRSAGCDPRLAREPGTALLGPSRRPHPRRQLEVWGDHALSVDAGLAAVAAAAPLAGMLARLGWQAHRAVRRLEDALPTLESIAETFPGSSLEESIASFEHSLDLQSQALFRLASIIDRRRAVNPGEIPTPDRRAAQPADWRPEGWEQGYP